MLRDVFCCVFLLVVFCLFVVVGWVFFKPWPYSPQMIKKTTIKINPLIITAFQQTGPCS